MPVKKAQVAAIISVDRISRLPSVQIADPEFICSPAGFAEHSMIGYPKPGSRRMPMSELADLPVDRKFSPSRLQWGQLGDANAKAIHPAFDLDHSWARFVDRSLFGADCGVCAPGERPPDEGWSGPFYSNPDDPALFVPKRYGIGYTLNFGNPWSWIVVALDIGNGRGAAYFVRQLNRTIAEIRLRCKHAA